MRAYRIKGVIIIPNYNKKHATVEVGHGAWGDLYKVLTVEPPRHNEKIPRSLRKPEVVGTWQIISLLLFSHIVKTERGEFPLRHEAQGTCTYGKTIFPT